MKTINLIVGIGVGLCGLLLIAGSFIAINYAYDIAIVGAWSLMCGIACIGSQMEGEK